MFVIFNFLMKKYITFLFLLFCIVSNAQVINDTSKFVYTFYNYENGNKSSEGFIRNGKPDGYWKTYYENGKIKSEGNRKNYELDSIWKFYNDENKLFLEISYKNGKKNGIKTSYTEGEIIKENFINDIKQGFTSIYYENGVLRQSINFVAGKEQGIAKEYDKKGNVITLMEYKKGYLISKERVNRYTYDSLMQGKWVTFHPNGNIQSESNYSAGIKNGYFKEYDKDGNLLSVVKYVNGILQTDAVEVTKLDLKREYYPSGQIKKIGSFKNEIPEGVTREFSEKGEIINAQIYKGGNIIGDGIVDAAGLKQGEWKEYYETGELKANGKYENGLKIGEWKFWYENGKMEQKGLYVKGEKPHGDWVWYYKNEQILRKETYINGIENGFLTEYSDSGSVITYGEYVDGLEEGLWTYNTGDIKMEGEYKEGARTGEWKYWYDNGNLFFKGSFLDDNPDGKHTYYWDNGKTKEEGVYIMGKREGEWTRFNYDGTIFLVTSYKNGIEIKYDGIKIKPPTDDSEE